MIERFRRDDPQKLLERQYERLKHSRQLAEMVQDHPGWQVLEQSLCDLLTQTEDAIVQLAVDPTKNRDRMLRLKAYQQAIRGLLSLAYSAGRQAELLKRRLQEREQQQRGTAGHPWVSSLREAAPMTVPETKG